MKITLKNDAGLVKEVKKGWSWTVFFFGVFVPLIRGDLKWAGIMLITHFVAAMTAPFTFGLLNLGLTIFFCSTYNKVFMKELYEKGYRTTDSALEQIVLNYVNS